MLANSSSALCYRPCQRLIEGSAEYLERVTFVLKPSKHCHVLARKRNMLSLDGSFCLLVVVYLDHTRF